MDQLKEVPALARGLRILDLLASNRQPMRVAEIASTLGLPRSGTYELIRTLKHRRVVDVSAQGEVVLGPKLLVFAASYSGTIDLAKIALEEAQRISQACDETVQVAIRDGRFVIYIAKAESSRQVRLVSDVGRRLPAHVTGVGKALLAEGTEAELDELLAEIELERFTARSITDRSALQRELAAIRKQGYAYDDCESNEDARCVAAPVRDAAGLAVAAVSISTPVARMTQQRRRVLRNLVVEGAAAMSSRLGHSIGTPGIFAEGRSDSVLPYTRAHTGHQLP